MTIHLDRLDGRFAVVRLEADHGWPHWATGSRAFVSVTRTVHETSVICDERLVPPGVRAERDFVAYAVRGPLEFSAVGVLARLTAPLAAAGIPLLAISTFDTDILLLRTASADDARRAWHAGGISTPDVAGA